MFCATEDTARTLQRFNWPAPAKNNIYAFNIYDHRNVLPTMLITPSIAGLPSTLKSYVMPQLAQQQLPVNFPSTTLSPPYQKVSNFVVLPPSAVSVDCDDEFRGPRREVREKMSVRRGLDRSRRHSTAGDSERVGNSCYKVRNDDKAAGCCSRKRNHKTTSFTIADILQGRIGHVDEDNKKRRTAHHSSSSMEANVPPTSSTATGSRVSNSDLVRPWDSESSKCHLTSEEDSTSRHSSSTSPSSPARENSFELDQEDNDEDDEDIDVDDEESVHCKRHPHSSEIKSIKDISSTVCPLGALLRMANQTKFDSLPGSGLQDCLASIDDSASDENGSSYETHHQVSRRVQFPVSVASADSKCFRSCRKRRKTRTAFTNQQIAELERWFGRQKYLTPADRDEIAAALRLSAAQVITWFQNRRAKLKRDLEELKADVAAAKALGTEPSTAVLDRLAELTRASGLQQQQQLQQQQPGTPSQLASLATTAPHITNDGL